MRWADGQWDDTYDPTPDTPSFGSVILQIGRAFGKCYSAAHEQFVDKYVTIAKDFRVAFEKVEAAYQPPQRTDKKGRYLPPPHCMSQAHSRNYDRHGRKKH